MKAKLSEPLPKEAIKQHPTKTYLSSIKAIYVTERFNDVFGVGKWTIKVESEHANFETGMIVVKVTFEVPELGIYYESFGGNDNGGVNNKNFDLGDAYKGASTDAITKIGSYLGVGIDVFKGKHDSKPTSKPEAKKEYPTDDKAWITEVQFNTVCKRAKDDLSVIDKAIDTYKIKKIWFNELIAIKKKAVDEKMSKQEFFTEPSESENPPF